MYKIATLNKISSKGLERFSDKYTIVEDSAAADGILLRSQDMHNMELPENLLAIARAGAGVNNIPIEKCSEKGIVVFNTPGANANAVKELVLTSILMSARNLNSAIAWTKTLTENVPKTVEKNKSQFAGHEIKGKTLGVIGLGAIGVMVANAAKDLGMDVIGFDPYMSVQSAHELSSSVDLYEALDLILPKCDYITIHVPFMENTKELINEKRLNMMKEGVCLLNFSRDQIVNEEDVLKALDSGKLRKYVTDFPTDKIVCVEDAICIPHLGASTEESEENCARMAVDQIMDYLENGNITNSVNFPTCNLGVCTSMGRIAVLNQNIPSMLGKITGILAERNINISDLLNRSKGDLAYTLIDIDSEVDEEELKKALNVKGIIAVRVIQ
ncbi:phosphoglycerate dehydrogenase [Sinanaerobacter chloroacetimidivorans]|jgi:D-3-phosphoglycerate dehydrogenase|uniref:D-3-phosphoglycerate dehydrogenase n=1 Tax=Sinanaerobacter chloroacetimidivorans TaxID=2818044 RepID=A0A8J7W0Q9_9FIRM|nr:phosphoglycerate dehydrogenase [Sinanaerobacter chloroacetimidivorans]MBR0597433.1 phosphoglycerate dehydrogenase [Sinanaerobacter chloroacetimidivorans]